MAHNPSRRRQRKISRLDAMALTILADARLADPKYAVKEAVRLSGLKDIPANVRRIQRYFADDHAALMAAARERARPPVRINPSLPTIPPLFTSPAFARVVADVQRHSQLMKSIMAPSLASMDSFSRTMQAAVKGIESLGLMRDAVLGQALLAPNFRAVFVDPNWQAMLGKPWPR